jgi:hypothetical protein
MRILDYNLLRDSVITASSSNDLFPVANLYSKRKAQEFRFTGYTSENVVIYKAGLEFDSIIIDNHNITSTATVKFQANASDVWTSPSVDQAVTVSDVISYFWDSTQDYDYVRVLIEDTDNTEPVKIGMMYLSDGTDFSILPGWSVDRTIQGRVDYRSAGVQFYPLEADDKDSLDDIMVNLGGTISLSATRQQFGSAWPGYFIIDPDDLRIKPIYGIIDGGLNLTRISGAPEIWDGSLDIQEVF